jgi:membrane-bound lytic murein transglycosylase B
MTPLLLALVLAAPDASVLSDAGAPDGGPASWRFSVKLAGDDGGLRAQLVADFTRDAGEDGGVGEQALTVAEANALLDDPRADLVYGERTVAIVAPSMLVKQRQDHLDLMKLFLKPERLEAGAAFARDHDEVLTRTEKATGVDRGVIIGILMWESKLGTITGDYRVFNVFTSQAFFIDEANAAALAKKDERAAADGAQQARRVKTIRERARKNLAALVRQCRARGIDPLDVRGSWAGALGYPQFMPASLRWAEDGNGDGRIDLFQMDDSIASVGRYLSEHGFAQSHRQAVWEYNHEDAYVQGVLAFGEALAKAMAPDAGVSAPHGKPKKH